MREAHIMATLGGQGDSAQDLQKGIKRKNDLPANPIVLLAGGVWGLSAVMLMLCHFHWRRLVWLQCIALGWIILGALAGDLISAAPWKVSARRVIRIGLTYFLVFAVLTATALSMEQRTILYFELLAWPVVFFCWLPTVSRISRRK